MSTQHPQDIEGRRSQFSLRMTQEGWIYIVVLLFISTGGLLRNINLLLLLAGVMIAPLILSWRLTRKMMEQIFARRSVPTRLFAETPAVVTWHVSNRRSRVPSWQLVMLDHWQSQQGDSQSSRKIPVQLFFSEVRPGTTQSLGYRINCPRRGVYQIGPARLSTRFPLGLIEYRWQQTDLETVRVAPALGQLSATWDRRLLSHASGAHALQRKRGFQDEEFFALRPWRSGDSARDIHWRSTARQNYPMVRQYDTRSDRDFVVILDLGTTSDNRSDSPDAPADGHTANQRCELILSFAATLLAQLTTEVKGKIGFAVCGKETVVLCDYASGPFFDEVFRELSLAEAAPEAELGAAAIRLSQSIPGGTPFYVVSSRPNFDIGDSLDSANQAKYRQVEPWVRWLSIDSSEFKSLFIPPPSLASVHGESRGPLTPSTVVEVGS